MLSQSIIFTLTFLISISSFVASTEMTYEEIVLFQRRQIKNRLKFLAESRINSQTEPSKQVGTDTSESHKTIDDFLRMNSTETIKGAKLLVSHDEINELHNNLDQNQNYRTEQQIINMPATERKGERKECEFKINEDEKEQIIERVHGTTYNLKEKHKKQVSRIYNDTFGGVENILVDIFEMQHQWEEEKEEYDSNPLDEHKLHHLYMSKSKKKRISQHRNDFLSKQQHHEGLIEKNKVL